MNEQRPKSIGFYISMLSRSAHKYFEHQLKPLDLNRGSLFILKRLYDKDGISQNDLCDLLQMDKANITRIIAQLVELDYVKKVHKESDQRAYRLYLTEKANNKKAEISSIFTSWSRILTKDFSEDEIQLAFQMLQKFELNVNTYFDRVDIKNAK
ncbi:MarR family transcriptional regulator [bacterium]|nr:MAG: MarR family transcriptional regulator [bacterium]